MKLDAVSQAVARSHQSYNEFDCPQRLSHEFDSASEPKLTHYRTHSMLLIDSAISC
jgi:hypothetical protein